MSKPGEAPPAWKMGALCYGAGLDLKIAHKMLAAGEREALKQGCAGGYGYLGFRRQPFSLSTYG